MSDVPEVLLVDDNPADIELERYALAEGHVPCRVSEVRDGEEALALLRRQGKYAAQPRPDVMILDLSMPRKGGDAVLAEVRSDPELREIPVVVFSTSRANRDIVRSYELGANCFVSKPGNLKEFISTVQLICEFFGRLTTRGDHGANSDPRTAD